MTSMHEQLSHVIIHVFHCYPFIVAKSTHLVGREVCRCQGDGIALWCHEWQATDGSHLVNTEVEPAWMKVWASLRIIGNKECFFTAFPTKEKHLWIWSLQTHWISKDFYKISISMHGFPQVSGSSGRQFYGALSSDNWFKAIFQQKPGL